MGGMRIGLLAALLFVVGCHKNTASGEVTDASTGTVVTAPVPSTGTPPADSAPAPAVPAPTMDDKVPVETSDDQPTNGGRMAKPGWCDKDEDCSQGSVCEKCGSQEGQCVPGCHTDSQCGEREYCNQVQCIRCPCPGICEPRS